MHVGSFVTCQAGRKKVSSHLDLALSSNTVPTKFPLTQVYSWPPSRRKPQGLCNYVYQSPLACCRRRGIRELAELTDYVLSKLCKQRTSENIRAVYF